MIELKFNTYMLKNHVRIITIRKRLIQSHSKMFAFSKEVKR